MSGLLTCPFKAHGGCNTPAPRRPIPELRIINSTYGAQLHKIYSRFFIAPCGERIAPFFYCTEENGKLICNCFSVGYYPSCNLPQKTTSTLLYQQQFILWTPRIFIPFIYYSNFKAIILYTYVRSSLTVLKLIHFYLTTKIFQT